ncbi:MAG: hypothetical protein JWN73_4494 [Betaproteobacteria bacterium]|nr:hypothetical protein [Betaproteobacteria bacterium]
MEFHVQDGNNASAAPDLKTDSPLSTFEAHCRAGQLAYQVTQEGAAVFPPRVCAPVTGGALSWRISAGLGTVYSTTAVYSRDAAPYNVALINLDEGFRMMSRVEGVAPEAVTIGLRVKVRMATEEDAVRPVFAPVEAA